MNNKHDEDQVYELGLSVKARLRDEDGQAKIDLAIKPVVGELNHSPVFLREWFIAVLLGSFPKEERMKTAASAVVLANKNQEAVDEDITT